MNVTHVSASLSRCAGGIFEIELALAKELQIQGVESCAFGLTDAFWDLDRARWNPIQTHILAARGPKAFGYAPGLVKQLLESEADLCHLHTLWMYPSIAVCRWAQRSQKPYVVTPNGMLEPWALGNSAWKKRLAGLVYDNRMLQGAACLQANTKKEFNDIRAYGLKNPVCIIPNGVDLPEETEELFASRQKTEDRKILLFLGRLHPKKGLVNALKAWSKISEQGAGDRGQEEWQFVIAGWDQGGHEAELKRLCDELELKWADVPAAEFVTDSSSLITDHCSLGTLPSVIFLGPVFGETKDALLRSASAFILPSLSEGQPMSVLEAWAYGIPVLMTDECNLPEGFAANAAMKIGTDVESIAEGMRLLQYATIHDLQSLSLNGRSLVERQFTWPMIALQMKEVYEWVLGGGDRPSCVVIS